tara:strand:+ start:1420 stop:2139 length:720 start_codon:yes stop_codon:yes gene_type:complete
MSEILISKENISRIIKDVRDIRKNPLEEHGIYYIHDEENILNGYAMIVGPPNTPYQYGYYFFTFTFPTNYPYSPPNVRFNKNPYNTRFHPNFYRSGKVCLSILNTWRGETWTSCQSLSTVLLTLCSVMTENPLLHEPGISVRHKDNIPFNKIITYQNINFSLIDLLNDKNLDNKFKIFKDKMIECFKKNNNDIFEIINSYKRSNSDEYIVSTGIYSMISKINYNNIYERYLEIKKNILE